MKEFLSETSKKASSFDEAFLFKTQGQSFALHSLLRAYLDDRDGRLLVLAFA